MESAVFTLELAGPSSFEHLELLAYEIYLPLLTNPQNQAKWGETATKEVSSFNYFYLFLDFIHVFTYFIILIYTYMYIYLFMYSQLYLFICFTSLFAFLNK